MNGSLNSGTLLAGRYRILTQVGEGGFGTVYKALDRRKHGKIVAIKEINMAALSVQEKIEVTDSFNREITLLSKLDHKSLPRIHDQFTDPEHWYIVMDYIEGQTLEDMLVKAPAGRLSVSQAARIGIALCDVLSYLHDWNPPIIYRDVKPGNIMLTFWDRLYLIDFGIARRYRAGQLRDTGPLGSPGYAAPEQYGRAQTTPRTDIYGLGATLQTLLTGKEPLEIRLQGIPPDVYIPQKLQALISQMMDPDPFKRPLMIEVKRSLMPYISPFRSTQWFSFLFVYIVPTFIYQSGFGNSPFLGPYFLLVLAFIAIFCSIAILRVWRAAQVGLSLKAIMLIAWNRLRSSMSLLFSLTGWVCLLYAILARPPAVLPNPSFLWFYGAVFIIGQLSFLIAWLKTRRKMRQPNQAPTLQQMLPMQQQGQKRP
jgi:serine/threonine protein kinase